MKTTPYASAVGSLLYAVVCTRPDIAYAVVSRFLANPDCKWILHYLRKSCLCFGNEKLELMGYTDVVCCRRQRF
ncbi:unnamed protein product [Linum trigynum]|jgi:ATP-binding cassette subfamily B (MDR/TAP) protein 1|uniref:Uncharacterized protein n=1 Tax=Linum trigynum TaxID=586398 RepID=A0AAV2FGF0_9ROSI